MQQCVQNEKEGSRIMVLQIFGCNWASQLIGINQPKHKYIPWSLFWTVFLLPRRCIAACNCACSLRLQCFVQRKGGPQPRLASMQLRLWLSGQVFCFFYLSKTGRTCTVLGGEAPRRDTHYHRQQIANHLRWIYILSQSKKNSNFAYREVKQFQI